MDLTFSIVAFNNYSQIIEAVNSINKFTQKYSKEIIIVDNTDRKIQNANKDIIKQLRKVDNVALFSNNANVGFGKANNIALRKAKGKFFIICNPDILLIEDSFSKIIPYMKKNADIGAVIPRLVDKDFKIEPVYRRNLTLFDIFVRYFHPFGAFSKRRAYHTMQDMDYSKPFTVPFGQGSFLVVKTQLLLKLNGFDERYFMYVEDADLCRRINQISKLEYFPYTTVIHLWNKGSHKKIKLTMWHLNALFKYFKKWNLVKR